MERQFNRRHGAVARKFEVGDPVQVRYRYSQDWKAATVTKQIGGRHYDITLTDGSRWSSHVNQMRLRHIHQTADYLVNFFDGFNLPAPRTKVDRGETGPAGEQTANTKPEISSKEPPRLDNNKVEPSSKMSVEPRKSKRGHIPKRRFELDPDVRKYKYP